MKSHSASALGLLLLALSSVVIGMAENPYLLIIGNILAGVGCLILNALFMSLVVRSVSEEKRSTAMGFYQAVYGIGMTVGPLMMGAIVERGGYLPAYNTIGAIMAIGAILALPLISYSEKVLNRQ